MGLNVHTGSEGLCCAAVAVVAAVAAVVVLVADNVACAVVIAVVSVVSGLAEVSVAPCVCVVVRISSVGLLTGSGTSSQALSSKAIATPANIILFIIFATF
jgi:hypothetical protein